MSETVQKKAIEAEAMVTEVTGVALADPTGDIQPLEQADEVTSEAIRRRMGEIDMSDSNSIIGFGSGAQAELQTISQAMLADVSNKDVGPAGDSLRDIVTTIRGFSVSELDVRRKPTFWERLLGRAAPFAKFTARYETIQAQIDKITDDLLGHEHGLLKDIKSLDMLYEKTLAFYDELALYIAAGEAKLGELDSSEIPALEEAVAAAAEADQVIRAQELRDLRAARDDLERRVHDLKLTRQVTMQSLPSIRLVQENDKSLVTKINSTLVNTVPLWETQLAQAVTIQRSAEAAAAVRDANDLTNELLTSNAANLRESNKAIRQEMERGVFDIEAVKQANADLIGTIQESLQIADEGKAKRAAAEGELKKMEAELRDTLAAAKARRDGIGDNAGTAVPS
ncbi:toxic anion resistance protein [Phaeobacter gallaeciensis]|uniref:toxic anion resistance protein n=1 Tax=Phaeobacter gallaeciensis TaxID=60890 RepID=UPI00237EF186|nr:toxic anion resistance protein [Phaeobacter gallaeciensis]MDE4191106.1 toxic anion resistance protein [Phaeobacter gallaeciensis]MDE4199572.1 toxic anion resistance protein [Phaeobacter gallaeciensis]MDE4203720.1 toxic anion resistance protein [Phaeobacter gallaeciensis]MDE4207862.1 toxic anion resistance protein [Phaeobacter gallaeciensis]MDE4216229.1 toxic anion resistance protein [Phaeobacter gallaeciensis]